MLLEETQRRIREQFQDFVRQFPALGNAVKEAEKAQEAKSDNIEDVCLLLEYLYANMPLSDAVNYPVDIFLRFAEHGAKLMQEGIWQGRDGAEEARFLDYVVFHRVNTEGITACRSLFYEKLKERVAGKTVRDAILEVNYWCAQEAVYRCSDNRTLSAEAVYRNGIGRCGEESVFTVNALRSVGIPARQVYAHRWSHCDDNHAWVEVWDGEQWRYLGACEPEEVLDRGWFTGAASRAMMISTRVFGNQTPDGSIVEKRDMTTASGQLERYAKTESFTVFVKDKSGNAVSGAGIWCEVLNYAQLVPVISGKTDKDGRFSGCTGRGSLFIHVEKEYLPEDENRLLKSRRSESRLSGDALLDVRVKNEITVTVDNGSSFIPADHWTEFEMAAPAGKAAESPDLDREALLRGERRQRSVQKKYRDKVNSFEGYAKGGVLEESRANAGEILRFLNGTCRSVKDGETSDMIGMDDRIWREKLLEGMPEKDLRDCRAEELEEHLEYALPHRTYFSKEFSEEIFCKYILAPRIGTEQQSAYRKAIHESFTEAEKERFRKDPGQIRLWIEENIREFPQREYAGLITLPASALKYRRGSSGSKEILFAAVCRTLGIPAGINPSDGRAHRVPENTDGYAKVQFQVEDGSTTEWIYGQNWSVARRVQGGEGWQTLRLEGCVDAERIIRLPAGEYRVITANRLPRGDQFAAALRFTVRENEEKTVCLHLCNANVEDLFMEIPVPDFTLWDMNDHEITAGECVDSAQAAVFIWLEAGREPTEHILNEMLEKSSEFAEMGGQIHFVFRERGELSDPTFKKIIGKLPDAAMCFDAERKNQESLARRMYKEPGALPFLLVVDSAMQGRYAESGYNVGTGEMLLRIMRAIPGCKERKVPGKKGQIVPVGRAGEETDREKENAGWK